MNNRISRIATIVVGATLLIGAPVALSGCSIAQGVIQQATGGDGTVVGSVPADFPDVPLVDGTVTFGAALPGSGDQKAWTVVIKASGSVNPGTAIQTQLESAGWTVAQTAVGGVTDDGAVLNYQKDGLVLVVLVGKDGDAWTASYTVTTTAAQ